MAMAISAKREGEPESEINTTPLIDVMLVLLVMLIVSLPPRFDAVSMNLPRPASAPPAKPIVISIHTTGALAWDGAPITLAEADKRLGEIAGAQPQIALMPERLVHYGKVVAVMAAVQRHHIVSMSVIPAT